MLNIRGLLLGNFRVFSDTSCFRLAPLTILTGPNGSGKSTVTGSLSLLGGLNTFSLPYRLRLDSGKNPFGSFDMIAGSRSKERLITAGYDLYNIILGENVRVVFTFEKGRNFDASVKNVSIRYNGGNLFDFTFEPNRIHTSIGLSYLYNKLREIKGAKSNYLEMEHNNDLKRRNLNEYLKSCNTTVEEYERLFYFYGKHMSLPGNDGPETEMIKKAAGILADFADDQILFNNDLLVRILEIPSETLDIKCMKAMISKDFPDLFDCLVLLNNPDSLNNIVDLLRSRDYASWENEFLEYEISSSKRLKGIEATSELYLAVDHNLQARFDRSRFFRAVTGLSMTREGFIQSYHRYRNIRKLSAFCCLVLEKIIHDLQTDLGRSVPIRLKDLNHGMTVDFNHPMHDLIRNYSNTRGKDHFLRNWFRKFKICDDFSVDTPVRGMGYFPGLMKNDKTSSLATEGSGTNRLMMLLLGIANARQYCDLRDYNGELIYYPGTIILEQPESELHPSWQSKLADMFVDAHRELGLHFLIETHSEYIINKLQYLVTTGKLNSSDIVIYYLDNSCSNSDPKQMEITIDENGNLSQEIPGAFLDEEDRRAMGLFRLRKVSRN